MPHKILQEHAEEAERGNPASRSMGLLRMRFLSFALPGPALTQDPRIFVPPIFPLGSGLCVIFILVYPQNDFDFEISKLMYFHGS